MYKQKQEVIKVNTFKYQNYWLRVFIPLPIIVLLPTIERTILENMSISSFFIVSTIITMGIAFIYFKNSGSFFEKIGKIEFSKEYITIEKKYIKTIPYRDIISCALEKKKLYGIYFAVFRIEYIKGKKLKNYIIISEELKNIELKNCSLWNCYKMIEYQVEKIRKVV